jgi:predicted transcriptional regulator
MKQKFTEIDVNTVTSFVKASVNVDKKEGFTLLIEGYEDESLIEENLDRILDNQEIKLLSIELAHDNIAKCFVSLCIFKSHAELKFNMARILPSLKAFNKYLELWNC